MSTQQSGFRDEARPGRMVRLKSAFYFSLVLILVFLVVVWVNSARCRAEMRAQAESCARAVAGSIAVFGNKLIVSRDYRELQERCDELVQGSRIAYIAISDAKGRIVVHTNREHLGRDARDIKASAGVIESSQSAMDLTKRVGRVYVGVRLQ